MNTVPSTSRNAENESGDTNSPTTSSAIPNVVLSHSNVQPTPRQASKRKKKPNPPIFSTVSNTFADKNNDFVCPICFEMIEEAYMTKCGHSFCYQCITKSLEEANRCPKCNFAIERKDQIYPNFSLNDLILKYKQGSLLPKRRKSDGTSLSFTEMQEIVGNGNMDLEDVSVMLELLKDKRQTLLQDSMSAQLEILQDFLLQVRKRKQEQLDQLNEDLKMLDEDLKTVEQSHKTSVSEEEGMDGCVVNIKNPHCRKDNSMTKVTRHISEYQNTALNHVVPTTPTGLAPLSLASSSSSFTLEDSRDNGESCAEGFNASQWGGTHSWSVASSAERRKRVYQHFEDLEMCYFSTRHGSLQACKSAERLENFTESLTKFTRYSNFRPLATLSYASDVFSGSSIVSSIEFDRDCDFFAIAGVTKKIKVFEYGQVIRDVVDIHYPVHEMTCNSKISCITWSQYHKGMLASSDYEGTVTLWDAFAGTHTRLLQEHEKRCWSVDFNAVDPKLLASGSDDAKVKLWATNMEHSVTSLEARANVCCVKFNPDSRYHLAFGSADHCVHYYDLRNTKKPLGVLKGHKKAVSYAKFVSPEEVVSASTDSQLKLWDVTKQHCLRTFKGHTNEKNFVGLATNGDYIACGSENNSLYVYYKGVSKQLLAFKFDSARSVLDKEKEKDEANEFVSAVCWKPDSNIVVAANSQGAIKVLELV